MRCWLQFIDTGVVYGNEGDIGKALKEELSAGKVKREDLFICSKLNQDQHAESAAYDAVKGSLKALNLDYIDLVPHPLASHRQAWPRAEPPCSGRTYFHDLSGRRRGPSLHALLRHCTTHLN